MIEVEIKFRVPDRALIDRLVAHAGLEFGPAQRQRDLYFNHPQRCFRETDEALRIRTTGDENALTYKAPRLDTFTRTRPETEIPFASGPQTADQLRSVLLALGFREIAAVEKQRRTARYSHVGQAVEVTLDEVTGLGQFLEIEMLVEETAWEAARDQIVALATQWEILDLREPKSYLRMLLESPNGESLLNP
jgi:adenylate cyclase class 2